MSKTVVFPYFMPPNLCFNYVINKKLQSQKIEMLAGMLSTSKKSEVSLPFFLIVTIEYNNEYIQRMVNHTADCLY
jgi:hypothetical protein